MSGRGEAYCRLCHVTLCAQKHDLKVHCGRKTHKEKAAVLNLKIQKTLSDSGIITKIENKSKIADIKLVLHIAAHSSVNTVDHLSKLLKEIGKGSQLEKLRLHRTKCSKLILNVVAPAMLKELVDDIGEQDYSIILDESTDMCTVKYMGYCVRYFSKKLNEIVTDFLGFHEVSSTTAVQLYKDFKKFLTSVGLKIHNLIGLGTDGASNLCGIHHSLYTLLKNEYPKVQLIKCSCHSLNLVAAKACEELPSSLEFLLRETRNWFSHSPLRQMKYKEMYAAVNNSSPPKLAQLSNTRWLAWYDAVSTNLKQWQELKKFFETAAKSSDDKCYTARTLSEMYNDDTNFLYLIFVKNILQQVTSMNLAFQPTNADITKLYSELRTLITSLAKRFLNPSSLRPLVSKNAGINMLRLADIEAVKSALEKTNANFGNSLLPLDGVDLGDQFASYVVESKISKNALQVVEERAVAYLKRLCTELVNRLPDNLTVIEKIQYFSPKMCLSRISNISVRNLLWELAEEGVNEDLIETQWRKLGELRMEDIPVDFNEHIDITKFWISVSHIRSANGDRAFGDLADFAIRAPSLPISNAVVERVFSVMGVVKTKLRNRMLLPMLAAITRIRTHMNVCGVCCKNYSPTEHMLQLFTHQIYENTVNLSATSENDNLFECMNILDSVQKA